MKNLASMKKELFAIVAAWDGCRSKYSVLNVTFENAYERQHAADHE